MPEDEDGFLVAEVGGEELVAGGEDGGSAE